MEKNESNASDPDVDVKDEEDLANQLAGMKISAEGRKSGNLVAYIAGSALDNDKTNNVDKYCPGGIAVFFPDFETTPVGEIYIDKDGVTNNRAEYMAALKAIDRANGEHDPKKEKTLEIRTTLKLLVETMYDPRWIDGWKAKNWRSSKKKPIANVDLLERLLVEERGRDIVWVFERKKNTTYKSFSHMELTHAKANEVALALKNTLENSAPRSD